MAAQSEMTASVCGFVPQYSPLEVNLNGNTWSNLIRAVFKAEQEMLPFPPFPVCRIYS